MARCYIHLGRPPRDTQEANEAPRWERNGDERLPARKHATATRSTHTPAPWQEQQSRQLAVRHPRGVDQRLPRDHDHRLDLEARRGSTYARLVGAKYDGRLVALAAGSAALGGFSWYLFMRGSPAWSLGALLALFVGPALLTAALVSPGGGAPVVTASLVAAILAVAAFGAGAAGSVSQDAGYGPFTTWVVAALILALLQFGANLSAVRIRSLFGN